MRTKLSKWTTGLLVVAAAMGFTASSRAALKVGDPAPKLQTGKWVQGEPVKDFEKGKAYIVEFWATWCGPCRASIPHLNETWEKYKDKGLVVIGQNCWEEDESLVAPFVKKMAEKMTYRVALDDKEGSKKGKMAETWMDAAGRNGIPSAFLVDTSGNIAWIGHPMSLQPKVIEAVLAGTFDSKKAAAESEQEQKNMPQLQMASKELQQAMQAKDWDTAMAKVAEIEKLLPEDQRGMAGFVKFSIYVAQKNYPEAYDQAKKTSEANPDDAMLQNNLAWAIAADKTIEKPDLKLAETFINRGLEASKDNPVLLDTQARILFMQGKKEAAIEQQEKAVKLADANMKPHLQKSLDSYKKDKLPDLEAD